ncbi:MAG: 5'-nucleotidase C-terminal domain-containing protein [Fimbriimonadaceae bacterium]|nr:5'-nucleotidase C-terminal domain-containing protein [Fimbriimonadaceae bacterium]QYK55992.1 MAG: 5'-nucleotidase C-terminal domain-containing protein [Fimbriimonadaceae bacterium]
MKKARVFACLGAMAACLALAGPDREAFGPAQVAADYLRSAARTDIAFLPAGVLKPEFKSGDLSGMLQFPTDDLCVVQLTGAQLRAAMERSVSLYPSPNPGFLQVSGISVTFKKGAAPNKRVVDLNVAGADVQGDAKYKVAMPGSLARGGLGYFTIWDRSQILDTLPGQDLESVLKGKSGTDPNPRVRPVD